MQKFVSAPRSTNRTHSARTANTTGEAQLAWRRTVAYARSLRPKTAYHRSAPSGPGRAGRTVMKLRRETARGRDQRSGERIASSRARSRSRRVVGQPRRSIRRACARFRRVDRDAHVRRPRVGARADGVLQWDDRIVGIRRGPANAALLPRRP